MRKLQAKIIAMTSGQNHPCNIIIPHPTLFLFLSPSPSLALSLTSLIIPFSSLSHIAIPFSHSLFEIPKILSHPVCSSFNYGRDLSIQVSSEKLRTGERERENLQEEREKKREKKKRGRKHAIHDDDDREKPNKLAI